MARTDSTKTLWQVQVRLSRNHKWRSKGIYETRDFARYVAVILRTYPDMQHCSPVYEGLGVGFGNTRVVRHIRGEKK